MFVVDGGRTRDLERRARVLGFADLRGYLQAHSDAGLSVPQLAAELGVSPWMVKQTLTWASVKLPPRAERLARQRRHATQQRLAARAAQLGFADLRAYLADRLVTRGWLLAEVTAELGAHRRTVRRLMDQHGIRRARWTPREQAAGARGRRAQAATWQARRVTRLAELGFPDLAGYLQCRFLEQGWSVRRMRAELRAGRRWLVAELARLGASSADTGQDSSFGTWWRVAVVLGARRAMNASIGRRRPAGPLQVARPMISGQSRRSARTVRTRRLA